ncbi:2-hydroxy-acid oxidase [Polynucleobacter hirudinilacicola]|uniref:D-lactate dehydrogenase (cytochrome) n=1 Tax=Polynucleobacter hirudinilacicola TaxID=1743166 RepID=A0A210RWY3_9BURK|nr:FAD-linked oxidase C-terminal domain-containing protein [Polynucleobacter hirudinilacicola]OWF65509.1 2-hydroxy-acid oxidase [Polynucleobacter hirudinilacicola]
MLTKTLLKEIPADCAAEIKALFGERFSISPPILDHHGRDESPYPLLAPQAVVFANTTEEVAALVKICDRFEVPIIPFGAGTSLEGHILPIHGGIALDLNNMNRVIAIHPEDMMVTVEPAVRRKQLNAELKDTGYFFPVDPGADASIGGMCATRASGTNAVRYGTMRENVLALTVVTASGEIIRTGTQAKKSSAGYDLTRLFVGSEGTLGIITEITLKIYPQPEEIAAAICSFSSVTEAVNAVIEVIQMGIPVARVELVDELAIAAINQHSKLSLKPSPTLFFEFIGSPHSVQEQAQHAQEIVKTHGGQDFEWAIHPEDRARLWHARHNAYFACLQLQAGCRIINTDVCVPISKLAQCIDETRKDLDGSWIKAPILGHVGDGNYHVLLVIDPDKPEDFQEAERLNAAIVQRALRLGGTCTGEHGVGMHKIDFLVDEHGAAAIDVMRTIKQALDPKNILNPGKMIRV